MIICEVNKNHLNVRTKELLTAGSQNVNTVEFRFNAAWDGLAKTATFKTSKKTISVLLNTNTTAIPWEALADAGEILAVGVFGVSGETLVLPTVWGILGKVMDAAHLGDEEKEPTPDVYQKILDELNALERPTWDALQNKPFSTLGSGLAVDENGVLSAQGGSGGSANAVQYVAQTLTDEQKAQARTNIGASPIPTVRYWLNLEADNIINLYNMGVGYGIISPVDIDQTVPTGMSSPMLVIFGKMNYGIVDITVYDGAGAVWRGSLNLSSQTTDVTKTGDYVTNTALTDILQDYVPVENYVGNLQEITQAIETKLDKNQGTANAGKILGIGEDGIVVPQDKPTYTLPQATADALGGIKADAATAEDTQVVRIGTDGKLRTKPTGGSSITVDSELSSTSENPVQNKVVTAELAKKITAPTTAAVGQIIKVKSVDDAGKPTEWEAVTAKLANPNALTFTGAVTGSYDGSAPLSVEIPSGGGGSGGSGKAKSQILINQEITELTASLSVTMEHDFHNLTAIINSGSKGVSLTADSDGNAVGSKIGLCIDTTNFGWQSRKVARITTSNALWETKMMVAEWSDDLSVFKRGFTVDVGVDQNKTYNLSFGGMYALYGTLGTDDNSPRTGKTANIVVNGAYLNVGTRVVLWGEYYE